jgi:8-oxo-dGTP pyrophosphatase MutT (NUDIX family)
MTSPFKDYINRLKTNLSKPLPGMDAQYSMAPVSRMDQLVHNANDILPKESAVLALLYPENDETMLVLIKRAVDNSIHSGQISFPGGQAEPSDPDEATTALRETEEELGIDADKVTLLGKLTPVYISPSNFNVIPFVGYMNEKPDFKINKKEVDKVIVVPVSKLLKPDAKTKRKITTRYAVNLEVPCFITDGEILWGATAMMINELLEVSKSGISENI